MIPAPNAGGLRQKEKPSELVEFTGFFWLREQDLNLRPSGYEIEDPWGKFRLDETSVPWNDAIDDLLQSSTSDRKFVVTSRSDVLKESAPKTLRPKWLIRLEEENYGQTERRRLFENRLPSLPYELQSIVVKYVKEAVEQLATPLEMHRYFGVLSDGTATGEHERDYINRCLQDAHQNSIETSIVANVRKRDDWKWAAIVWGLFKARDRQSFNVLPRIQAGLSAQDQSLEDGLSRYISFLVAGRNLRQADEVLTYQHPRVELGLEQAMLERTDLSSRVLRYLAQTFANLDRASGSDWGTESAAHLMAAIKQHDQLHTFVPGDVTDAVDAWLEARISAAGPEFEDDLKLAAAVGSSASVVAELARWLTYRHERRWSWTESNAWKTPERPTEWYNKVAGYQHTRSICEAFIARSLPRVHGRYPSDFADQIARLSPDLAPAFARAASLIVESGYHPNEDAIIIGALKDLDRFEPVVGEAIEYLARIAGDHDREFWLALKNGHYDEEAADHYYEDAGDQGYTARELLEHYARLRRSRDGWKALADHPQAAGLVEGWLRIMQKEPGATDREWQALASLASGWEASRLWELVRGRLPPSLHPFLEKALHDGSSRQDLRTESVRTAIADAPDVLLRVVKALAAAGEHARLLELALDAKSSEDSEFTIDFSVLATNLTSWLQPALAEVVTAFLSETATPLSAEAISLIENVGDEGRPRVQLQRARVLLRDGLDVRRILASILRAEGDDSDQSISDTAEAVELAEAAGYHDFVAEGLTHRFADVRERALAACAARSELPLGADLLELANDEGHRVRRRLVEILDQRRHPAHIAALLKLCGDEWSNRPHHYEEDASYPIAVGASEILLATAIDDNHVDELAKIVKATRDSDVQLKVLRALVRNGSDAARKRVTRLALTTGSPPLHRYAAYALLSEADKVTPDEAGAIGDDQLQRRIASVALPLAYLLGQRAPEMRVLAAARALSQTPGRLVMMVPLVMGAFEQNEDLGRKVHNQLPLKLKDVFAGLPDSLPEVTARDLSEFGEVRVVEAVAAWLAASRLEASTTG